MALITSNFFSSVLGMERQVEVILPQPSEGIGVSLSQEEGGDGKVPVLYLLHGMSDDQTIWLRRTNIERYAEEKSLAVVMAGADLSFYCDMTYGGDYFRYFSEELPRLVHEFFPMISQKREDTYVAGNSMGGFGALKLALAKPQQYAACVSFSGFIDPLSAIAASPEKTAFLKDCMGTAEEIRGSVNDLPFRLEKAIEDNISLPRLMLVCGTEDFLYPMQQIFRSRFEGRADIRFLEGPGSHTWQFWEGMLPQALEFLTEGRKEAQE